MILDTNAVSALLEGDPALEALRLQRILVDVLRVATDQSPPSRDGGGLRPYFSIL